MNDRDRKILIAALLVSVLAHVLIALPIWDMPIGQSQAALFNRPTPAEQSVPAYRMPAEDMYAESLDPQQAEPLAVEGAGETPKAIERASRDMLERLDPMTMLPEETKPVEPLGETDDRPRDEVPESAGDPSPPPARLLDASAPLIDHADPNIDLPRFVEPDDTVQAPAPSDEPIDSAAHLSLASLVRALTSDSPAQAGGIGQAGDSELGIGAGFPGGFGEGTGTGTGTGTGNSGTTGTGTGEDEPIELLIPLDDLPPIVDKLPDLPPPDKPTVHLDGDFDYVLRTYDGPVREKRGLFGSTVPRAAGEPAWYEIQIRPRASLRRLKPLAKDVVYVVDTSSSIQAKWLAAVKTGVASALDALNEGDRFNIIMFEQEVKLLTTDALMPATKPNIKAARAFIKDAKVAGFTDVNKALSGLVKRRLPPDRVYQIIFISDGTPTAGAISPQQIIDVFTRENAGVAAIYAVAVGDEVNEPLLESLAYRNKGYVERPDNSRATTGVIRELASRLRYPILKDATFTAAGVDTRSIYPRQPRDVHQHDPISMFGRYIDNKQVLMRVAGDSGPKRMDFTFKLSFKDAQAGEQRIAAAWARAYTHHLMSEMLRRGASDAARLAEQIDAIRKRYGID
jgi:uncharacterized protein YegL